MAYLQEHPIIILIILSIGTAVFYIGRWVGKVNSDSKSFNGFMEEVKDDIKVIRENITEIFNRLSPLEATGSSPLTLTELGENISEYVDAKKIANQLIEEFDVEKLEGDSFYTVQEYCKDYILNKFKPSPEQDRKILDCAYEHGVRRNQVENVIAIELRDRVIEVISGLA